MEVRPPSSAPQTPVEGGWIGFAVDRFGNATFADVLASLVRGVALDTLSEAIDEFGLEMAAERFLRAPIESGKLHGDEAAAYAEEDRILGEERHASPEVHPITVADLADGFTRLGPIAAPTSCG